MFVIFKWSKKLCQILIINFSPSLIYQMLNLLAITLLAVIVKNPGMMQNNSGGGVGGIDSNYDDEIIPTPVSSKVEPSPPEPTHYHRDHSLNYQDMDMGGLVCLCMIAITLMLIYGTIKGRPSHLLPFFFLQLCDFAITTLTAAGYLCYLRTIHHLIEQSNRLPWKDDLIKMDPRTLGVVVLFAFIFMVMLKAYCIGIVWRCYKYLTIRQNAALLSYIIPESGNQERSFANSLLPDYEEALSMKITPPPSYQIAMQQQQMTVALSPPSDGLSSPIHAAASDTETDPPSYNMVQRLENEASPTHEGSLDGSEEIQVETSEASVDSPVATQAQPQQRDE
jgi:lysosomal-associated transmembrane protein